MDRKITYKDSIAYNISFVDTTIYFPEESVELDGVKVHVDTAGMAQLAPVIKKEGRATVKVAIKDNILTASANCDSLEKVIKFKNIEISRLKEKILEKNGSKIANKTSSFTHFTKWYTFISLGIIVLVFTFRSGIKGFLGF